MAGLFSDITRPRLLIAKGVLFLLLGVLSSAMLAGALVLRMDAPWWILLLLHGLAVWSFCRAYYFAFYVIDRYIGGGDSRARYAGLCSAARSAWAFWWARQAVEPRR